MPCRPLACRLPTATTVIIIIIIIITAPVGRFIELFIRFYFCILSKIKPRIGGSKESYYRVVRECVCLEQ